MGIVHIVASVILCLMFLAYIAMGIYMFLEEREYYKKQKGIGKYMGFTGSMIFFFVCMVVIVIAALWNK